MNCFYHPDKPAVALCKSCERGVCMACAADIGNGVACLGKCEDRARRINDMLDSNPRVLQAVGIQQRRGVIYAWAIGVLFLGFAVWLYLQHAAAPAIFLAVFGIVILLRAATAYSRGARFPSPPSADKS